jgi:hypothetical protein
MRIITMTAHNLSRRRLCALALGSRAAQSAPETDAASTVGDEDAGVDHRGLGLPLIGVDCPRERSRIIVPKRELLLTRNKMFTAFVRPRARESRQLDVEWEFA